MKYLATSYHAHLVTVIVITVSKSRRIDIIQKAPLSYQPYNLIACGFWLVCCHHFDFQMQFSIAIIVFPQIS